LSIVPSGQGKSRIEAMCAAIEKLIRPSTKVHLVYENTHLMERDKANFELLWLFLDFNDGIDFEYHVGIDFKPASGDLIIIDEADCFIFNNSEAFFNLIKENACICFTATPDNKDLNGVETRL
jgi:hypothetical protein